MTEVLIRQKSTGIEYVIQAADFRRGKYAQDPNNAEGDLMTYEQAGYEIVAEHPSGLPYEPPARSRRSAATERESAAAEREEAPAAAAAEDRDGD